MAREWHTEPATLEHAEQLAPQMRAADRLEIEASLGVGPLDGIVSSIEASPASAWSLYLRGELAALFGVVPRTALGTFAVPWVLTGTAVDRHPRAFWRASSELLLALLDMYPVLVQYVDARYVASLRWLARLGAQVDSPVPFGVSRLPFHRVTLRRTDDV